MVTIGLASIIDGLIYLTPFGTENFSFPAFLPTTPLTFYGVSISWTQFVGVIITFIMIAAFTWFFKASTVGISMRAVANDQQVVNLPFLIYCIGAGVLVTIVVSDGRDTTDMINLINYGQVFRYVLKPIQPAQLREDIMSAAIRHINLLSNPDSAKRHNVIDPGDSGATSKSISQFVGDIRARHPARVDPGDTIS